MNRWKTDSGQLILKQIHDYFHQAADRKIRGNSKDILLMLKNLPYSDEVAIEAVAREISSIIDDILNSSNTDFLSLVFTPSFNKESISKTKLVQKISQERCKNPDIIAQLDWANTVRLRPQNVFKGQLGKNGEPKTSTSSKKIYVTEPGREFSLTLKGDNGQSDYKEPLQRTHFSAYAAIANAICFAYNGSIYVTKNSKPDTLSWQNGGLHGSNGERIAEEIIRLGMRDSVK